MHELSISAEELLERYTEYQKGRNGWVEIATLFEGDAAVHSGEVYNGKFKLWSFNPASLVAVLDFHALEDFSTTTELKNWLTLEVVLQGSSEVHVGSRALINHGMPRLYITSHGENCSKKRVHRKGDQLRCIGMWISPALLQERFGLDLTAIGEDIQDLLSNSGSAAITFPLTQDIKAVCSDIVAMSYDGRLADQYLKAKFTELLCCVTDLVNTPIEGNAENLSLPRGKSIAITKTVQALEQSRYLSMSLGDIATELGFCQSTLSNAFKEGFGIKLSEYLLQRRMHTARQQLKSGRVSVLDVALSVGYENQSSFGRAYRQFFGRTPREDFPQGR